MESHEADAGVFPNVRGHVAASQPTLGCHLTLGLAKPLLYQFTCILGIDTLPWTAAWCVPTGMQSQPNNEIFLVTLAVDSFRSLAQHIG